MHAFVLDCERERIGQRFTDQPGRELVDIAEPHAIISGTAENLDLLVWTRADWNIARVADPDTLSEFQAVLDDGVR